jgi:serine/threonine protein kinase
MAEPDPQRVREVFDAAAELSPAEREVLLARACGEDAALRAEVEQLLDSLDEAGDFIEQSAVELFLESVADQPARESTAEMLGRRIGPYRILRELGRGGMGVVYLAARDDGEFRKQVAIKLLPPGADEKEIRRVRRERQILADLDHPNIARLIDGGSLDGRPYVVMEFVEGQSLREMLDAEGALPLEKVREIARQVCAGLDAAHRCGVIHRDIKPANLIVAEKDGELRVKILDFGIAKLQQAGAETMKTQTGVIIGTVSYMPPEQVADEGGARIDARADIYSFGMALYEMLAGRPAFTADSYLNVLYQHQHAQPTPPHKLPAGSRIPPAVSQVILKALAKDPAERQQSALQLADEFESACRDAPARPRRKWARGLATAAAMVSLVLSIWAAARWRPGSGEASPDRPIQAATDLPRQFRYRVFKKDRTGTEGVMKADDTVQAGDAIHVEITLPFAGQCYLFYEERDGALVWANPRPQQPPQRAQAGQTLRMPESGWIPFDEENPRKQSFIAVYTPDDVLWSLEDVVPAAELNIKTADVYVPYARIQSRFAAGLLNFLNARAYQAPFGEPAPDGIYTAPMTDGRPRQVVLHRIILWHVKPQNQRH